MLWWEDGAGGSPTRESTQMTRFRERLRFSAPMTSVAKAVPRQSPHFTTVSLEAAFNERRDGLPDRLACPSRYAELSGLQVIRGMPFLFGSDGRPNVALLDRESVRIDLGGALATYVLVVHVVEDAADGRASVGRAARTMATASATRSLSTCSSTRTGPSHRPRYCGALRFSRLGVRGVRRPLPASRRPPTRTS